MSDATATSMQPGDDLLFFNGLDCSSGEYLLPPMPPADISRIALGEQFDPRHLAELKAKYRNKTEPHLGVKEGVDPKKLEETGWGVIFAADADLAVREALSELLTYRKEQATRTKEIRYKEYSGADGYLPDESASDFLLRHGIAGGPANPDMVPYYLLIVGDPETIPFSFQYQLDVQYGVGRIHFDTLEEYANYAHSVVAAEKNGVPLPRRAVFFATANADDPATAMSCDELVTPLADLMKDDQPTWQIDTVLRDQARKARLGEILGGADSAALLFTASHGGSFPRGNPLQVKRQGCLLCQDWPGPKQWKRDVPEDFYFSGEDVSDSAHIPSMITFHFACFGAGTPRENDFRKQPDDPKLLAPRAFVAHLPQRLLGHPKGGALASIGHVERAWQYSFTWPDAGPQLTLFQSILARLMKGYPVGWATEYLNERYAELAATLSDEKDRISKGKLANASKISRFWTAQNDARNFAVVGDPAVRLSIT